jgi:osmotically-inducible protein OsmY
MQIKNRIITATAVGLYCSALAAPAIAQETGGDYASDSTHAKKMSNQSAKTQDRYDTSKPELRNAWLEGKLETALLLNRHLNNFTIDNEVRKGKATLTGSVESEIDRKLAEEVAHSVDGITAVDNQLKVESSKSTTRRDNDTKERAFSQKLDDMTTTAMVKSKLLADQSTHGLAINVDTINGVVSIQGDVTTHEEKQLAEKITANTDGVREVKNLLKVKPKS